MWLEPGQTKNVEFVIDRDVLSFYDEDLQSWIAEPGEFKAMICASSEDVRTVVNFTLI